MRTFLIIFLFTVLLLKSYAQVPAAPVLISPPNYTFGASYSPDLQWQNISGADSFYVMVALDTNFTNIVYSTTTPINHQQMPLGIVVINVAYYWKVRASNSFGAGPYSLRWVFLKEATAVSNTEENTPKFFKLSNNYPNPFNPNTVLSYQLPVAGFISLKVYDAIGNEVQTLVNEKQNAGSYSVNFNAASLPSGIYFYKLVTDKFSETKKMILIK